MSLQFHFYLNSEYTGYSYRNCYSLPLSQCHCYIQWRLLLVIIFNNQIFNQILDPSGISCSISNLLFWSCRLYPMSVSSLGSSYIYKIWCGGFNNYLRNVDFYIHISFFFGIIKYVIIKESGIWIGRTPQIASAIILRGGQEQRIRCIYGTSWYGKHWFRNKIKSEQWVQHHIFWYHHHHHR